VRYFATALHRFLQLNAAAYDVVDYDHVYLPYPRGRFSGSTLMVARAVLLVYHFDRIQLPRDTTRSRASALLAGSQRRATQEYVRRLADRTLRSSDLINVLNESDRVELELRGFPAEKIVVIPPGLTEKRLRQFVSNRPRAMLEQPRVAFVGTLDVRKGVREMPEIVSRISRAIPQVRVRLIGARNLTTTEVLERFPVPLHAHLEIYREFAPEELPSLLDGCSIGIFPSRIEGFGFGVLEMLAAALPVIAYDAPGAPMMLSPDYLVSPGDAAGMARKVVDLLSSPARLVAAQQWAKRRSADFKWERSARTTSETYISGLKVLRGAEQVG
jgi:glycosyltransferase involved in cell wall biosynthesis